MLILVVHASFDGQSRLIAERMAATLRSEGHTVEAGDVDDVGNALDRCEAVIVGGGVRYGRHAPRLERFAKSKRAALIALPNAFFSVCMSAGSPRAKPDEARRYVEEFRRRTGWVPDTTIRFAGALRYRQYNPLLRLVMRMISRETGASTDTSRNHDYTDWAAVDRFARGFAMRLAPARAA